MFNTHTAILDFGSGKITVLVGKGEGEGFKVLAKGVSDYAGFMDGEFLEPEALRESVAAAISQASAMLGKKIKGLYVGVPAEFSFNNCQTLEINFAKPTKIKPSHVGRIFSKNKDRFKSDTHTIVNKAIIYFKTNKSEITQNAVGALASSLSAYTSFIYVDNKFINQVTGALSDVGVNHVEFVANSLAQGLCLISAEERAKSAVLIDCGYISTSVTYLHNDGVLDLKSFSLGGGHITSDLAEVLKIPFESAEQLKRKLVISLNAKPQDYYEVLVNDRPTVFSAKNVNEIAKARLDMFTSTILSAFAEFSAPIKEEITLYFTGGGINYVKGIKNYLTEQLELPVVLTQPALLQYAKPDLSSELSLLEVAISLENA